MNININHNIFLSYCNSRTIKDIKNKFGINRYQKIYFFQEIRRIFEKINIYKL